MSENNGISFDDYMEISSLKARYFQYLDNKHWDGLDELFSEDARFEGFAFEGVTGKSDFISTVATFLADVRSQHQGFMPLFKRIDLLTVRGVWSMHDYLTWAPDSRVYKGVEIPGMHGILGYGYYEEEYTQTANGWRISFSRLVRTRIDALVSAEPITPNYSVVSPTIDWVR